MKQDQINNYNSHAKFMAEIAQAILKGNKEVLNINGVKEIIALYLMLPYMTPTSLDSPDDKCFVPKVTGDFCQGVTIKNLRDSLGHSFVTVEEDNNDGTHHGKVLIIDDRATKSRNEHSALGMHSTATLIPISFAHSRLLELLDEIQKQ